MQGSLAVLVVRPESLASIAGTAAGEPLHFERMSGDTGSWALVPVPLSATDTLPVSVAIESDDATVDTLSLSVPVKARPVGSERLRPPSRFRRLPDSAVVARANAESESVAVVLKRSHDGPRLWTEGFLRPVPGKVNSGFGAQRAFAKGVASRHRGADLAGPKGEPVKAANRGVVVLVGDYYYGGRTVLVDHGAGLVTAYEHLSSASVAVGDTVARGTVVGKVGATGRATGPHLHWAAFYGRVAVDPLELLTLGSPR
jgi:murein DD-endopeptidase MepM/ murein hydrolase activator NlpD